MGVSWNGGTPIAGWFTMDNPIEMDDDWEYPYSRKPPNMFFQNRTRSGKHIYTYVIDMRI